VNNLSFRPQVDLLLKVLPLIGREKVFALKGGTAINLFIRNMPRLSVDIDLTFLPLLEREETFSEISSALARLKKQIESSLSGSIVKLLQASGTLSPTTFTVDYQKVQIKVEVNYVLSSNCCRPTLSFGRNELLAEATATSLPLESSWMKSCGSAEFRS
jgi:hypothetical protein